MENIFKHRDAYSMPELQARFVSFYRQKDFALQNHIWVPKFPNPYSLNVSRVDGFPLKRRKVI